MAILLLLGRVTWPVGSYQKPGGRRRRRPSHLLPAAAPPAQPPRVRRRPPPVAMGSLLPQSCQQQQQRRQQRMVRTRSGRLLTASQSWCRRTQAEAPLRLAYCCTTCTGETVYTASGVGVRRESVACRGMSQEVWRVRKREDVTFKIVITPRSWFTVTCACQHLLSILGRCPEPHSLNHICSLTVHYRIISPFLWLLMYNSNLLDQSVASEAARVAILVLDDNASGQTALEVRGA